MGQFFNSIRDVGKNYKKFDEWEQAEADKIAQRQWLAKNLEVAPDKFEATKNQAQVVIRATEIMDSRSEDNCENVEQMTGIVSMVPALAIPALQILGEPFISKKVQANFDKKIKIIREQLDKLPQNDAKREVLLDKFEKLVNKKNKTLRKIPNIISMGGLGFLFLTTVGLIVYGNKKQKEASRIGRYQAKQDELKGLENFDF